MIETTRTGSARSAISVFLADDNLIVREGVKALKRTVETTDLLRRIQAMATQSNLTIRGFTPQAVAKKAMHAEWPIGLQLEGTYHDLGAFLERVSKFPRIINVSEIVIKAKPKADGDATIVAECMATTFVLQEKPVAPVKAIVPACEPVAV